MYLCGVYLLSTGSNHEIEHACEVLAHDISSLPPDSYVLVAGDVNARCAVLPDFFISESSFDVPSTRLETKLKLKFVPRWLLNTQSLDKVVNGKVRCRYVIAMLNLILCQVYEPVRLILLSLSLLVYMNYFPDCGSLLEPKISTNFCIFD